MIENNLYIKEISLKDESYLKNLNIIKNFNKIIFSSKVAFLVGENGRGKSTLLEAIAVNSGFNAEGFEPLIIDSYGGTSLHKMSHGECFMALMANRFSGNGLYILDEPEAALSPLRQMTMLKVIDELVKKNSQFIIVTHSPILMAYPGADIFVFDDNGVNKTSYKNTDNYIITRKFLENPEKMIRYLLE